MSKRKGKQMNNLPHSYIETMEGLQMENEQLRQRILTLEHQAKDNEVLGDVSNTPKCPKCNSTNHYKYTFGNMIGWANCNDCKTEYEIK